MREPAPTTMMTCPECRGTTWRLRRGSDREIMTRYGTMPAPCLHCNGEGEVPCLVDPIEPAVTLASLRGTAPDMTGGMESVEFVRHMRDGKPLPDEKGDSISDNIGDDTFPSEAGEWKTRVVELDHELDCEREGWRQRAGNAEGLRLKAEKSVVQEEATPDWPWYCEPDALDAAARQTEDTASECTGGSPALYADAEELRTRARHIRALMAQRDQARSAETEALAQADADRFVANRAKAERDEWRRRVEKAEARVRELKGKLRETDESHRVQMDQLGEWLRKADARIWELEARQKASE